MDMTETKTNVDRSAWEYRLPTVEELVWGVDILGELKWIRCSPERIEPPTET